jgi:hypothetical protein
VEESREFVGSGLSQVPCWGGEVFSPAETIVLVLVCVTKVPAG